MIDKVLTIRMKIDNGIVFLFTHLQGLDFFTVTVQETRRFNTNENTYWGDILSTPNAREDLVRKTSVRGLELCVF